MIGPRIHQGAPEGDGRRPPARDQVRALLFAPLPELNPPGFRPDQLAGLRALPAFCGQLKLVFGLRALEPLANSPPAAILEALTLTAELLAAVGRYVARSSDEVPLRSLRDAAILTRIHLRARPDAPRTEEPLARETLFLEAAELALLRRARSAGTSEVLLGCAAGMLVALWQLADQLRQSPGADPGELNRANGTPAAPQKILFMLAVGCAADELASEGRVPVFPVLRPSALRA